MRTTPPYKTCRVCGQTKPKEDFVEGRKVCLSCFSEYNKQLYRKRHADRSDGVNTAEIDMEQLNLNKGAFYDPSGERIGCCFKLYPWEWMMNESLDGCKADILWLEPMWKSLMSNKAMLPILSELYPDSPYILKCTDHLTPDMKNYCKKPVFSREGANVTLVKDGVVIEQTGGDYGEEGYVYQELVEIPSFDGKYPVIGSWVIGGLSAGMGIRETSSKVTGNLSEFIPHIIE